MEKSLVTKAFMAVLHVLLLKLNCLLHGFRQIHATLLFEGGNKYQRDSTPPGHSDISMTMDAYTHITDNAEEKVISTLMEHFGF
jgi:integrase